MTEGLILETHLHLSGLEEFFAFHSDINLIFLIIIYFFSISPSSLPAMCPSPQFAHSDSFEHLSVLSIVWLYSPQFR